MDSKDRLREIIREELKAVLEEQARNWWQKPAEAEVDGHLEPSNVHEAKKRKPRAGVGKKKSGEGYTSAGTVAPERGRKMTRQQIKNRKEIGQKMLNAYRRGGEQGKNLRKSLVSALKSNKPEPYPTDKLHQYSKIWARASAIALKGGTAADWPGKKQVSKKKAPPSET